MTNPLKSLIEYIRSSRAELEKVSWPTRQQTLRYSLLVVGVSAVMAAFFFALDFGLGKGIDIALSRTGASPSAPINPITPDINAELENSLEKDGPSVQGFDEQGNPVDIQITPITDDAEGGITVTP